MKIKTLLILAGLLLFSLACTLEELGAAGNAIRSAALGTSPTQETEPVAPLSENATETVRSADRGVPENEQPLSTYHVCTGTLDGKLRVRNAPGTSASVEALLSEGDLVAVSTERLLDDSTWAEIADPAGWVNVRYLCKGNSQ